VKEKALLQIGLADDIKCIAHATPGKISMEGVHRIEKAQTDFIILVGVFL
jgi:hypothetical protein